MANEQEQPDGDSQPSENIEMPSISKEDGLLWIEFDGLLEPVARFDNILLGESVVDIHATLVIVVRAKVPGTDFPNASLPCFAQAPAIHPNSALIKGVVCGVRVEEVEDPLMQKIRYLDKLIDDLAKGKAMEKILR